MKINEKEKFENDRIEARKGEIDIGIRIERLTERETERQTETERERWREKKRKIERAWKGNNPEKKEKSHNHARRSQGQRKKK